MFGNHCVVRLHNFLVNYRASNSIGARTLQSRNKFFYYLIVGDFSLKDYPYLYSSS